MGSGRLTRAILLSYLAALVSSMAVWLLWDWQHAFGLFFGCVWSATNIWSIKGLIEEICNARRVWIVALFAQLKLPVLYGIGGVVLLKVPLSVGAGIFGFHIPFAIIVYEAVVHGSQETQAADVF